MHFPLTHPPYAVLSAAAAAAAAEAWFCLRHRAENLMIWDDTVEISSTLVFIDIVLQMLMM